LGSRHVYFLCVWRRQWKTDDLTYKKVVRSKDEPPDQQLEIE